MLINNRKVYGSLNSPATLRVLACVFEHDLDFEFVPIDLNAGEHKNKQFLSMNPFGQVPVYEDGDIKQFEERAITTYIAENFKETGYDLISYQDQKKATLVKVWVKMESQQYNPVIKPVIYQHFVMPLMGKSSDQTITDASIEKVRNVLDVYEAKLSSTKYLAGDFYSLADLHHLSYTYQRPHVKAWWDFSSRPAFKKLTEAMIFGGK
ncbi:LOW QUALITY PROTEIN: GST_C domain-containing protein/GST_N domain-containing protein, partial [Cephalotus follicularis]